MHSQTVFHPSDIVGADGWTETGGGTQPPNRALPAPIFDSGNDYRPNNGNTGTWIIEKVVLSDIFGPGFLTIPAGTFPSGGGLFADDQVLSVTVNGTPVPFSNLGTGNIPPQSQPVSWVGGVNTIRITVNNTVAGGTSIAGRLVASGPGMPCDCCRSGPSRCAVTGVIFDGAHTAVFAGGPGVAPAGGAIAWSDGTTAGSLFTGYTTPNVQLTAVTSPIMDLEFITPQDRITGLREWNQGGGDLNDQDGFASWDYEFFAGVTSLLTGNMTMGNGGAPFTHIFPGGLVLNGVTRVRLSNMRKLNPGAGVAPLVREVQAIQTIPAFPCRRPSGAIEWYDVNGDPIPTADITDC
jgi:hypothetical protein